ncbi:DegV family protein [Mobilitalea sibirica]|uniref:DegV family protein n=1 Tax=Mobilitalea sibirica TaxID=1462919 RepID=A0A8J7H2Q2_9FIRM|nr:DegV family protein [Mobilitalea sibirica]MBH1941128.1 DegV family protein [Mobilitalea sibirica]
MAIRIITDSTSDIGKEQAKQMDITIVPLKVIFGDKEYREGVEITIDGFYEKLVKAEKLPTTSQPSPDDFLKYFNEAKEAGDSVIVVLISSKLSGTVQSALIAKDMVDYEDIYVVDSYTTITGLRILVEQAVKLRNEGMATLQIVDTLEKMKDKIVLLAMVDTLEYLHKGGRLSKSSAILGSLLKFKPIITLKDGVIGVVGKERGTNKAIAKIIECIEEFGAIDQTYPINLGYTAEDSQSVLLRDKLSNEYGIKDMIMYPVGCVVGTHVGPGACVLTYVKQ